MMYQFKVLKKAIVGILLGGVLLYGSSCTKEEVNPGQSTANAETLTCDFFKGNEVLKKKSGSGADYILDCNVVVENSRSLEIEPGVIIVVRQGRSINVRGDGFLMAKGTADKPIIFRGESAERGYWGGILFDGSHPKNELKFVELSDAGGVSFSNNHAGGVMARAGCALKMSNTTITNCKERGFDSHLFSRDLTIENNTFKDNELPAFISITDIDAFKGSNKCKGNDNDYVVVEVYTRQLGNATWHKLDVKYRLANLAMNNALPIAAESLVTIEPGVEIEFPSNGTFVIKNNSALKAVGTENDPIIFSGVLKETKAWKGIHFYTQSAANELKHVVMEYSGSNVPGANVYLFNNAALRISNTKFRNITGCAIYTSLSYNQTENPNLEMGSNIEVDNNGCLLETGS